MKTLSLVASKSGMSLIEVMVVSSIVAIISLTLMQVLANSIKADSQIKVNVVAREFRSEIDSLLVREGCGIPAILGGGIPIKDPNWAAATVYDLPQGLVSPSLSFKPGDIYDSKLNIYSVQIGPVLNKIDDTEKYIAADRVDPADFANSKLIMGTLRIQVDSSDQLKRRPLMFTVFLKLSDDQKAIVECNSENSTAALASLCTEMGGDWDQTTQRCNPACPEGMAMKSGECVSVSNDESNVVFHCQATDACMVGSAYKF